MAFRKQPTRRFALKGTAATLVVGLALLSPAVAFAQKKPAPAQQQTQQPQQQQQPGSPPQPTVVQVKAEPSQPDWTKVCGKDPASQKEICYTTRDFVSDQGQPVLAVAVYDVKGEPQKMIRFLLPLGLLIQPGIRVSVDQGQPTEGKFALCFPNGCFAEVPIKEGDLNNLKKSQNVNVSVQNQVANVVTFQVPLTGFAKGFDGPAIDPKVLEEQQKKLQEELQKRSEEMRKKLEAQQGTAGAATGSTGAPAAPAAAAPKQ